MNQKDIKLLWGRAANRCSKCRVELSQDKTSAAGAYSLGEQAHIVGEKVDAPRGKSPLTAEERNSYHNLILLCPNHHTEIDKNESDWPAEKLYCLKSAHELWVRETLGDSSDTKSLAKQVAVTSIIDAAVELCGLERWKDWTSGALAAIPHWEADRHDKLFEFRQRVAAAIWPDEYAELRRAATTLAILLYAAVSEFMEHSRYEGGVYWADMFYKSGGLNPKYDQDLERYENWLDKCWRLMKQAACAANWFADVVRRDINPMFFAERGKFVVLEGMFDDLSFHASIPEFTQEEKNGLPESLIAKPT